MLKIQNIPEEARIEAMDKEGRVKHFKLNQINKSKLSILEILLKCSLVIGLSACSNTANKENTAVTKNGEIMLNELFKVEITSPGRATMTKDIILKYFLIGMHERDVLAKLQDMGLEYTEWKKEDPKTQAMAAHARDIGIKDPERGKRDSIQIMRQNKPPLAPGSRTLEIIFYFNDNDELVEVFSRVYSAF